MKENNVIEVLSKMLGRDGRKCLKEMAIKDGVAYVSDGRIALKFALNERSEDSVPAGYPIESINEYLKKVEKSDKWFDLDSDDVALLLERFADRFKDQVDEDDLKYAGRYQELECPECGETVYYDNWNFELVDAKEARVSTDSRDVEFPVQVILGDRLVNVAFPYLNILGSLGNNNLEFSAEDVRDKAKLYIRTKDRRLHGVLMPLLIVDGKVPKNTIHSKEAL